MSAWPYRQTSELVTGGRRLSPGAATRCAHHEPSWFRRVSVLTQRVAKAFDRLLERSGLDLENLYRHGREHEQLHQLAELLTEWDERIWVWRFRHYPIVARALGEDTIGTQGTPVQVLGRLITQRQIPKLWEVLSRLVELLDAERKGGAAWVASRQRSGLGWLRGDAEAEAEPGRHGRGHEHPESRQPVRPVR